MAAPRSPVFLERRRYRRRRLTDAARLLPILGALLLAVPLLWSRPGGPDGDPVVPLSAAMLYIFGVWALLIVLSALFGRQTRAWGAPEATAETEAETGTSAANPPRGGPG